LAFMCNMFAVFSNFVMIPGHAQVQGMTSADIALFLSVIEGVMIFARPTVGWLADSGYIEKRNIVGMCYYWRNIFSITTVDSRISFNANVLHNFGNFPKFF
jgi:hypothetical protein